MEKYISESHLFGFLVGMIASFIFRNVIEDDEKAFIQAPSWAGEVLTVLRIFFQEILEKPKTTILL
ncbi:MAG: hypothetical protein IPO94_01545 [Saprospiraceae bacterium]|nr:hypothetical protein [Saprospiraceae bacterium]